jgi:DNA-binding CsgD family transcriptional regulator
VSLDRVAFKTPAPDSVRARYRLTVRELQVASLLMHRFSNAEIARMLGISPHTARHHTENVLLKFGVRSRAAARRLISCEPAAWLSHARGSSGYWLRLGGQVAMATGHWDRSYR